MSVVVFTQYMVGNKPVGPFTWNGVMIALTVYERLKKHRIRRELKSQVVRILNGHSVDFAVIGRPSVAAQATFHGIVQQRPIVLYVTANVHHLSLPILL